jgi:hypothetical protein
MAAIVLAFAPEDRDAGDALGEALAAAGYEVQATPPPSARSLLVRRAAAAQAVVVLWSRHAPGSAALIRQVAQARRVGNLVPVQLDAAPRPASLVRGLGVVDMRSHDGFDALLERLAIPGETTGNSAPKQGSKVVRTIDESIARPESSDAVKRASNAKAWIFVAGVVLLTTTLVAAYLLR